MFSVLAVDLLVAAVPGARGLGRARVGPVRASALVVLALLAWCCLTLLVREVAFGLGSRVLAGVWTIRMNACCCPPFAGVPNLSLLVNSLALIDPLNGLALPLLSGVSVVIT